MMDRKEQVTDKKGGCGFETAPTLFIFSGKYKSIFVASCIFRRIVRSII